VEEINKTVIARSPPEADDEAIRAHDRPGLWIASLRLP
jgi:hypothetical protein